MCTISSSPSSRSHAVAERDHLAELPGRVDVQQREGRLGRDRTPSAPGAASPRSPCRSSRASPGCSNSATTSRMMWMLSASSRCRCVRRIASAGWSTPANLPGSRRGPRAHTSASGRRRLGGRVLGSRQRALRGASGIVTRTVSPVPPSRPSLTTAAEPPCDSAIAAAIARPRPGAARVARARRVAAVEALEGVLELLVREPGPGVRDLEHGRVARRSSTRTVAAEPGGVWARTFASRLSRICRSRSRSPSTSTGSGASSSISRPGSSVRAASTASRATSRERRRASARAAAPGRAARGGAGRRRAAPSAGTRAGCRSSRARGRRAARARRGRRAPRRRAPLRAACAARAMRRRRSGAAAAPTRCARRTPPRSGRASC